MNGVSEVAARGDSRILLVECTDKPGLVYGITRTLLLHKVNIVSNQEFVDREAARFFMRTEFDGTVSEPTIETEVRAVLPVGAIVRCTRLSPPDVVILATREHHCLADLLVRHAHGELNARILAVIANRLDLQKLVSRFELPFHHVPCDGLSREQHEVQLLEALNPYQPEFLVLAKYMRVLSPPFVARFPHRIVNIHHSFLPAFAGARPYSRAFERGVKVIGATAHFVTDDLDEGPIITQQVLPIDHTHTAADLAIAGRDVERLALGHALKLVFEQRVFTCGRRTIIFD